jgi:hypothetical protein
MRAIGSRAERRGVSCFLFSRALSKRREKERNSEDGFEDLETLSLSWLGVESAPFVLFGFLFEKKKKERCSRILLWLFGELCGGVSTLGCVVVCAS